MVIERELARNTHSPQRGQIQAPYSLSIVAMRLSKSPINFNRPIVVLFTPEHLHRAQWQV